MNKKVITNPYSSEASGPEYIPPMVLKNCEPELCYILVEILNNNFRLLKDFIGGPSI